MTDEQKITRAEHMDLMRQCEVMRTALNRIARGRYDGIEVHHYPANISRDIARGALSNAGFDAAVIREGVGQ